MKLELTHRIADFSLELATDLPPTGITAIVGPSGAGKTTLLRLIAGFHRGQGNLYFGGSVLQNSTDFIPPERRNFAYVTQQSGLFSHLSVAANLDFSMRRARAGGPKLDAVIAGFGIAHLLERLPTTLSGGEAARVCLARSLLSYPRLLLLDEPFTALDEEARLQIIGQLRKVVEYLQIPVLMVVHEFDSLTRLAEHVLYLDKGKLLAQGPLADLLLDATLPFAAREDACQIFIAQLSKHDPQYELSHLQSGTHQIVVPAISQPLGSEVRLRIRAGDVSLSRQQNSTSSIINSLVVHIVELRKKNERQGQILVVLDAGNFRFPARITLKSMTEMNLKTGEQLFAQIKASAVISG